MYLHAQGRMIGQMPPVFKRQRLRMAGMCILNVNRLEEIFTRARGRPLRTFPVAFPLLRLDRIYVKNAHASHPKALALKHWRHLSEAD
jgi:endonuclease/exonuclease/phosphatase family metal-dependent hydrolase